MKLRMHVIVCICVFATSISYAGELTRVPSLSYASASSAADMILAKINTPVPTLDQLSYAALLKRGVSSPTYHLVALRILHKLLVPKSAQSNQEIPYAQQKRELALQLLPEIMQHTPDPQQTLASVRNVMVELASRVPYWHEAALDFIAFIQSQANIIKDEEQYLNELVSLIILRPTLWNRADKIDFMQQIASYIVRKQQMQHAKNVQRYAQKKKAQREKRALREQEAQLSEDLAARGITFEQNKQIKKIKERTVALPAQPFAKPLLDLISQLLFATSHDIAPDRTQLDALTQFVFPDGSYTSTVFYIVQANNPEALEIAIAHGAPLEELNSDNINALIVAIDFGAINVIEPLLEAGIPISESYIQNNTTHYRFNALMSAINRNQLIILKMLLAHATDSISDLMLEHCIIYAQNLQNHAATALLTREFQERKGIDLINAVADNDIEAIKLIVEQSYLQDAPQLIIDGKMLSLANEASELKNTASAYALLATYNSLFQAIAKNNLNLIKQLLQIKAEYIDLEMLNKLLQSADKNGYQPIIDAIQDAINAYRQNQSQTLPMLMEEQGE